MGEAEVVSRKAHEPGEEAAPRHAGAGDADENDELLEVALCHVVAEAGAPDEHAGRKGGRAKGADECARLEVQADETR